MRIARGQSFGFLSRSRLSLSEGQPKISAEQLQSFHENGYLIIEKVSQLRVCHQNLTPRIVFESTACGEIGLKI
jgi:hypothetical protein